MFPIRAAHIDIGRQPERIDFLKDFILMASKNGFNAVELYLEGRIRTKSFPWRPPGETVYTEEEMRDVAAHAASLGMEIIPVVSILSCCKQFLKSPELARLGELQPETVGRFRSTAPGMLCPSHPGVREFLEKYLAEIASIFPGRFFHAGCDETWHIGRCPRCKEKMAKGESESEIWLDHMLWGHQIISGRLGRRMMIWDDMLEFYPDALQKLPRDIVMVSWKYHAESDPGIGHFCNGVVRDRLNEYDELGFDYFICPAEFDTVHNIESYSAYLSRHRGLGVIFAAWEKWDAFMNQSLPWIAYAGRMLAAEKTRRQPEIFGEVVKDFFGVADPMLEQALYSAYSLGFYKDRRLRPEQFMTHFDSVSIEPKLRLIEFLLLTLPAFEDKVKPEARDILRDTIMTLRCQAVALEFQRVTVQYLENPSERGRLRMEFDANCRRMEHNCDERIAFWKKVREGVTPCNLEANYEVYRREMRKFPEMAESRGHLKAGLFLPDQYCAPLTEIFIRYTDSADWEKAAAGQMKALPDMPCYYTKYFFIDNEREPSGLRVVVSGFGGQGFTWFETANKTGRRFASSAKAVSGQVSGVENLLHPDRRWCYAGELDVMKVLGDQSLEDLPHAFEIKLENGMESEDFRLRMLAKG